MRASSSPSGSPSSSGVRLTSPSWLEVRVHINIGLLQRRGRGEATAMHWVLIGVIVLVGLAALIALAGSLLPKAHSASRRATFRQPPEALWRVLTDYTGMTSWRADV